MRACGVITSGVLTRLAAMIEPGINVLNLEFAAINIIDSLGAKPACKGYNGFPGAMCISINDEIIHGIPKDRTIQDGDLVKLDLVVEYQGVMTDSAMTVIAGNAKNSHDTDLVKNTERVLYKAIELVKPGTSLKDIAHVIESHVSTYGFNLVREFGGHGIGYKMHEPPFVANIVAAAENVKLVEGMTFAIEPMVNLGTFATKTDSDNWTIRTADGSNSAHFEHTVLVTADGYEILTRRG